MVEIVKFMVADRTAPHRHPVPTNRATYEQDEAAAPSPVATSMLRGRLSGSNRVTWSVPVYLSGS